MERFIEKYRGETFDIAVIGGGITGAAVAYDAASRGFSVALIEKSDFGGATSAATSKMIHGGLRYLANGEIGLVRESLKERKILENIAPNLVRPLPSLLAVYSGRGILNSRPAIRNGMILYDILSPGKGRTWDKSSALPVHRSVSKRELLGLEENVRPENLKGGFIYYDCLSLFPERLTLAFIRSSVKHGAKASNYLRADDLLMNGSRVTGVKVSDLLNNTMHNISASLVINCTGPWADILLSKTLKTDACRQIRRSEGVHFIIKKMVGSHWVGLRTESGRHIFFVPWRGHTLVGTTDEDYTGDPDDYRVSKESLTLLLDEVNRSFADGGLSYSDILHAYGGLRPLVEKQTKSTYTSSRHYEICDNSKDGIEGLITVEGGKYTTSRNLAEKVMKAVRRKSGRKMKKCITDRVYLHGCEIKDTVSFFSSLKTDFPLPGETLNYLGTAYGSEYKDISTIAGEDKSFAEPLNSDGEILAEAVYALRHEMARTLPDILLRRTGLGTLGHPGDEVIRKTANIASIELGWDKVREDREIEKVERIFRLPE